MKYFDVSFLKIVVMALGFCLMGENYIQAQTYGVLYTPSSSKAEKAQISEDMSLEQALEKLEQIFGVVFLYRTDAVQDKKVADTYTVANNVEKALDILLENQGLNFKYLNPKTYGIYSVKEKSAKNKVSAFEQVRGTVTDAANRETLPGVNILIKGTTVGTSTDPNGQYSLNVPSLQDTLVFSFIGYQTQEVPINERTEVDVQLEPEALIGEELVVIAYGEQSTETITGSVSSVTGNEITGVPAANIGNAISGKLAGIQTVQASGGPGSDTPDIFIRGVSSLNEGRSRPLYILDGVIVRDASSVTQLDPDNIESISVLKDAASLAVFGIEGANGAIVVQTKRGRKGPMRISFNTSSGIQVPINLPEMANSYDTARMYNLAQVNDGVDPDKVRFSDRALQAFKTHSDPLMYPDIDWFDYILKPTAFQTKTNITLSGGTDDIRFLVAGGFLRQDGLFKTFDSPYDFNPRFSRYNFRTNLDFDVTPSTKISLTASGRIQEDREQLAAWTDIYRAPPYAGAGIVDGRLIQMGDFYIPGYKQGVLETFYGQGYNQFNRNVLNLHLSGTQKLDAITQGLALQVKGSYNAYFTQNRDRRSSIAKYQPYYRTDVDASAPGDSTIVYKKIGADSPLDYGESYGKDRDWYVEARLEYNRDFGPHNIKGLLLYNQRQDYYPGSYRGIPRGLISSVGRINYNYNRRYLLELNVGYNGSENFVEGQRFGFFPAVSGGWILTNEPYFPEISFLNFLKLRASYGITGNDSGIGRFLYLAGEYNENAAGYNFGYDNPNETGGVEEGAPGNSGVTWERAEKQDYGIDVRMFKDRLSMKFTWFKEIRSDILTTLNTVPTYVAANLPAVNVGEVQNRGYEAKIDWNHQLGDFSYTIGGNVSFAKNKILYMDEVYREEEYQRRTGKPVGQRFGYIFDGFYTQEQIDNIGNGVPDPGFGAQPGDLKYEDLNEDGVIDGADQAPIGYPRIPEYTFGANVSIRYKNIRLSTYWAAATHTSRFLSFVPLRTGFGPNGGRSVMQWQVDGRWTPEKGQDATYPRMSLEARTRRNGQDSDFWMRDASYVRLKNAELSYSFSPQMLSALGLKNLRIYVNGYNLLTFSKLKLVDPETTPNAEGGLAYPLMKVYNFGVNIDF